MSDAYSIKHVDDFEELEGSGGATWLLARKGLDASAFGFNVVDLAPGGELPEHDHTGDNQEEVYVVLDGEGTFVSDGQEQPAPAGTFARYEPEVRRTVRNRSDSTIRLLLIGVPKDSGYKQMPWA